MIRDEQKHKVYEAERSARSILRTFGLDLGFSLKAGQKMVEDICTAKHVPVPSVQVATLMPPGWIAQYSKSKQLIQVSPGWLRPSVVLHEMAHHLNSSVLPNHGAHFASIFLSLVTEYMGQKEATVLSDLYTLAKVNTDTAYLYEVAETKLEQKSASTKRWTLVIENKSRQLWEEHEAKDLRIDRRFGRFVEYTQCGVEWLRRVPSYEVIYAEPLA